MFHKAAEGREQRCPDLSHGIGNEQPSTENRNVLRTSTIPIFTTRRGFAFIISRALPCAAAATTGGTIWRASYSVVMTAANPSTPVVATYMYSYVQKSRVLFSEITHQVYNHRKKKRTEEIWVQYSTIDIRVHITGASRLETISFGITRGNI